MTNTELIASSLRELGVISETETPSAEQGAHGLKKLNQMIESWTIDDIDLGYFEQEDLTDDCPIPTWAERCVITKLSIDLAPQYGASISIELATNADAAYSAVLRRALVENLEPIDLTDMPLGEGNFGGGWNITQ